MRNGGFFKSNWAYLIWFVFYFSFAVLILYIFIQNVLLSLLIAVLLYGISVAFSVSPLGEITARLLEGVRPVQTQTDKDYLLPIFEEVYVDALQYTPNLNKDIKLYIADTMTVNAFAMGRHTIAVTRGAMETFTREELKGILAHEFGHIVNGDTTALLIKSVGNGFFTVIVLVLRLCAFIAQTISNMLSGKNIVIVVISFVLFMSRLFFDTAIFLFVFSGDVFIALNSRHSELLADEYAFLIGYGTELKNSLYIIDKISFHGKATLTERLKASHPYTSKRIEQLENLGA